MRHRIFSNSAVSPAVAIVATTAWLLAWRSAGGGYFSADEHEREAYDIGSVAAAGFFSAMAPVWWGAARAALAPPPDAMVLWLATIGIMTLGWFWRRYR